MACAATAAFAETDENGLIPKHWYKFNGNLDSSGETALTISGEKGDSYTDGVTDRAYLFKSGYHPYGSGILRGNGDFTVVTVARTSDRDHGIIWTQGEKGTGRGFGLVSIGASNVAVRVFGSNWSSAGTDLIVAEVPGWASADYHVYTLIYQNSGHKFSLYVDDADTPAGSGSVADEATEGGFPNKSFQFGSLNGGLNYSMTQGYDACLDDFRLYQQALTTEQIANIVASFKKSPKWGNLCLESAAGVVTNANRSGMAASYTIDFADASGLCYADIHPAGTLKVTELKLALADTTPTAPTAVSLSDGVRTISSTGVTTAQGVIYGPSATYKWTRQISTFTFDSEETLDTSRAITMTMTGSWRGTVVQPINTTTSDGTWSPVFLLSGEYTPARSIAINFNSSQGTANGGSGILPAGWNNIAAASATERELSYSDGTASGAKLTSSGGTYQWTGASDGMLKGYIDDDETINISVADIPFAYYDVIVYQATDTDPNYGGNSWGFNPPSINGTYYSYDGTKTSTTANDSALKYGTTRQLVATVGKNTVYVRSSVSGGFASSTLTIKGAGNANNARGCIAGIQIVEAQAPTEYTATVSANTNWADIVWSPDKPVSGFEANAKFTLNVVGTPTIQFTEAATMTGTQSLTINGTPILKAADALYTDGCWIKSILSAPTFTAENATFAAIRSGFVGAYEKTATGFTLRWQNREVISINIAGGNGGGTGGNSPAENLVSGSGYYGLAATLGSSWNNINRQWQSGGDQTITIGAPNAYDGVNVINRPTMSLAAKGRNTCQASSLTSPFLRGYLDDTSGVTVEVHGVPYTKYDVIMYATSDNASIALAPVTINGKQYTYKDGAVTLGSDCWGQALCNTPEVGKNALYIKDCTGGELTINATRVGNLGRATLCAVQVICQGNIEVREHFSATISESTHFGDIVWDDGKTFHEGQLNEAIVNVDESSSDEVTLTFDNPSIVLGKLFVNSSRDLRIKSAADLANVGQVIVTGCTGRVIHDYPVDKLESSNANVVYAGGAGTASSRVAIGHNGGHLDLAGGTYRLRYSVSATATTVTMSDIVADYVKSAGEYYAFALGTATYILEGSTLVTTPSFWLSEGAAGRTSSITIRDNAELKVTGNIVEDSNHSSIMFGHWNGTTTFTLEDNAKFTAKSAQVLVGKTGNNHTININGGTFTAVGIKAASQATGKNILNLAGGELILGYSGISSYADSCKISVNVTGSSKITSSAAMPISQPLTVAAGATLTLDASEGAIALSGNVVNNGTILLAGGVVRLASGVSWTGNGNVVIASGATLDLNGCANVPNVISLSGTGNDGAGALVNMGGNFSILSGLSLSGDATIGGTNGISIVDGGTVSLGSCVLTISGSELVVNLGEFLASGSGRIVVAEGTLALDGTTSLGANDLMIMAGGTLDLSSGESISCRNFKSTGTVAGDAATLIVDGTFDASTRISLAKLSLRSNATLKGAGLTVTSLLSLGSKLLVEADEEQCATRLAKVPADGIVYATAVVLNGQSGYDVRHVGTRLIVVKSYVVTAHVEVNTEPGTNFESVVVSGIISEWGGVASGSGPTNVYVTLVSDSTGESITQVAEYVAGASGEAGTFSVNVSDVEVGDTYTVSARVDIGGGETKTEAQSGNADVVVARSVVRNREKDTGGWIYEDAETFAGVKPGTGIWYGTNSVACATNGIISMFAEDWVRSAEFQPTNMSLEVTSSFIKDLHFHVLYGCPGFYLYEPWPGITNSVSAAFTLVADEDDNCCFAVVSNGVWSIVPRTVFSPEFETPYEVLVRLDGMASNIQYSVIVDGDLVRIATCPIEENRDVSLDLTGSGEVALIEGIGQDAHLAQVGDEEYWTIGDAIDASGGTNNVIPLWWSRYVVSGDGGKFRIWDPNGYLRLIWQKWHHWGLEDGVYRFISGNNWIEYADKSGVVERNDGSWLVTNEVGLAWVAAESTNRWIREAVSIGENLDFSSKNWTPIAQFSGMFDGQGHVIRGLNNTNVIIDALLGDAGYYFDGPTNDWGYMAYGLFASATNASFGNVAFDDVAISNVSDSTAVLLGVHSGGDLLVTNVEICSGRVLGEGCAVAGVLTVGGDGDAMGNIVVTGNVNHATIAGTIANGADGGNVAQILAGTSWDTIFLGKVVATNNVGAGDFDVEWLNHDGYHFELPVCNFAAAVTRITAEGYYRRFVEANDPSSVPIDPALHTARMLAGTFANGTDNIAGWWMDTITATPAGGHVDIVGAGNVIDTWEPVLIDRDLSFNLNSNFVYTVYDNDTFTIADGVAATVSNGVVYVGEDCEAFGGDIAGLTTNDVKVVKLDADFYERTVMVVDGMFLSVSEAIDYLHAGSCIELFEGTGLTIDAAANAVMLDGNKIAELSEYQSLTNAVGGDGTVAYMVRLNEKAIPSYDFELLGVDAGSSTVQINVVGARAGLYYTVQHKASFVEKWSEPAKTDWVEVKSDGSIIQFSLPASESSGFYRIKVTDYLSDED